MAPVVILLRSVGERAWLYSWLFVTFFIFALNVVYPIWIAPLFNTFRRLPDGPVRDGVVRLTKQTGIACDKIFEVDGSRQSAHSNAYVTGFGLARRIVIYDTLIHDLRNDVRHVCAVVAHEIGHAVHLHNWMLLGVSAATTFVTFYAFHLCTTDAALVTDFGYAEPCAFLYLQCFLHLYQSALLPVLSIAMAAFTRQLEFDADRYASELGCAAPPLTTESPLSPVRTSAAPSLPSPHSTPPPSPPRRSHDLREPLRKMSTSNLSELNPDPLVSLCRHSHPTLVQRIAAIDAVMGAEASADRAQRAADARSAADAPGRTPRKPARSPERSARSPVRRTPSNGRRAATPSTKRAS